MRFGKSLLTITLILSWCCLAGQASATDLDRLKKEAGEVLKLSFIEARAKIDVVFELAGRLEKTGQPKEALKYYEAGLQRNPWALEHQLAYALLLKKEGKNNPARERAKIVVEFSEKDSLVIQALKLLGRDKEADRTLPKIKKIEGTHPTIVLIPMGEVDVLLLKELGKALQKELGIPVLIQKAAIKMPPPAREPLRELLKDLRTFLLKQKGITDVLKKEGLTPKDLENDEKLIAFFRKMLTASSGPDAAKAFIRQCEDARKENKQWDAGKLQGLLFSAAKNYWRPNVGYIGITRKDMFAPKTSFVFGWSGKSWGLMSYRRFMAEFNDELPNRKRLVGRTLKASLSCAGHVFGIGRCSNPRCPLAYSHSVMELDSKLARLCPTCRKRFKAFFKKTSKKK